MTDTDWNQWTAYHATLFRWTGAEDAAMLNAWREVFEARGFTTPELREASLSLVEKQPKTWRAEHLEYLCRVISGKRASALALRDEEYRRGDVCRLCKGIGMVAVPDMRHPTATCGVVCSCELGQKWSLSWDRYLQQRREQHRKELPPIMTLVHYEFRNPGWEEEVERRKVNAAALAEARARASHEDRQRGPLVKVLREVMGGVRHAD